MLVHIDTSAVEDVIIQGPTAERSHTCIENWLLAHFEGNHVVSLLPDDASRLRDASPPWSSRARRALDNIEENYPQIEGLREDVTWSIELGLSAAYDDKAHASANGNKVIRASLHRFDRGTMTACSLLLGENATDADFFIELGLMRRAERRWERLEMLHEPHGTGGDTFAPEYARFANRGRLILAIADRDGKHPEHRGGGTYRKLEEEAVRRPHYQRARPIHTRTAEGLVPFGIYREVFAVRDGDLRLGSVVRLEQFLRSAPADVLRYAHLKDGLRLFQIRYQKTGKEGDYWSERAAGAKRDQCTRGPNPSRRRPAAEKCTTKDECECYVVDALGDKALADVVVWMKTRKAKRDLAARFDFSRNPELRELADEVLAWGIALPPLLT